MGWVRRRKRLYETAHVVVDRGEDRVKREVVGWWLGQVRQRTVADRWRVLWAGTTAIERWRQRVVASRRRRQQLEQADQLTVDRQNGCVADALAQWHTFASQQRHSRVKAHIADRHYERRVPAIVEATGASS